MTDLKPRAIPLDVKPGDTVRATTAKSVTATVTAIYDSAGHTPDGPEKTPMMVLDSGNREMFYSRLSPVWEKA